MVDFMHHIKFNYLYRDGANYKSWGEVVFRNPDNLSLEFVNKVLIESFLSESLFIASQISVPEKFIFLSGKFTEYDHCYHEYNGVEVCSEKPTDYLNRTIEDFLSDVSSVGRKGWVAFDVLSRA